MENITEGILDFKSLEKIVFGEMCKVAQVIIAYYMSVWDQIIMSRRDTAQYRCVDTRTSGIKTIMGTVTYERHYYKKREGGYAFLLDEAMGIADGYGLVSENLAEQILMECSDKSYRKAAESISAITGQDISRMGTWGVVQGYGERVQKQVERLKELSDRGIEGQIGNIGSPVVFEEVDDVWINKQREDRRKAGAAVKKGRKRIGMMPMHVGTAYTGWEQATDGRYMTINKLAYAEFSKSVDFEAKFEALVRQRFDMDGVEHRIMNGDDAAWIKTMADNCDAILQLDPFHRSEAIVRAVKDKGDRKMLNDALKERDVEKALDVICRLTMTASDDDTCGKLADLYEYFDSNKEYLLPWQARVGRMPEPPEGVVYRNLGTQEHNNCDLLTQRMKHRKGSWSTAGANNMAKVLCLRSTIGLDAMLGALPEPTEAGMPTEPLSAAKAPQHDGKGYDATWLYAAMPFEDTFVTEGRKAIRGLLSQRPLSSLSFI